MSAVSYFALVFASTLWLSRFLLRYMEPEKFLDHPSARKLHQISTPRFGGMAFGVSIIVLGWFITNPSGAYNWYFLGAIAMFALGAADDYWTLSWRYKLPIQVGIGLLVMVQFIGKIDAIAFFGFELPSGIIVLCSLFLFWFIGIVNAVNLIDGMDGLAGGYVFLTSFFALVMGWITGATIFMHIMVIYMGALAAFLHYNQKPAKFFMGDGGSLLLGYHVALLPLLFFQSTGGNTTALNVTPFVILASYLIIDTTRIFYDRIRRKKHPLEADQNHFHHLLFLRSGSYKGTLLAIFMYLSIFGIISILLVFNTPGLYQMIFYLLLLIFLIFSTRVTDFGVQIMTRIIQSIKWDEDNLPGYQAIVRIRFLPIISFLYFLSLFYLNANDYSTFLSAPTILVSLVLLMLFTARGSIFPHNVEIVLVGVGLIQIITLNTLQVQGSVAQLSSLQTIVTFIRYISLSLITIITVVNYLMRSKEFGAQFWRISDLLVLFILIGLASIQSLGVGIPASMSFELGILYLANKLSFPRMMSWFEVIRSHKSSKILAAE